MWAGPQSQSGDNHDLATEFFTRKRPDRAARRHVGEELRKQIPLDSLAKVPSWDERQDALTVLRAQEDVRAVDLIPLRYERMSVNPFAYLRGAAAVMASDLSLRPPSGIEVQLCGDAHLENFGMFASQERRLVFDLNDFDETNPGPFEWDVKRLAASFVLAARNNGFSSADQKVIAQVSAESYRQWIADLATQSTLEVWYSQVDVEWMLTLLHSEELKKAIKKASEKARGKNSDSALTKLTEGVNGERRFRSDPPLLVPVPDEEEAEVTRNLAPVFVEYIRTLAPAQAALLARYSFSHIAFKVVGVGSVGTRAYVLLLESGNGDPLILQAKQANPSVLEEYVGESGFANHGQRVVAGTRMMQATGDPFLGWCHGGDAVPYDFYFRQLWDMKGSIDTAKLGVEGLTAYARVCGAVLARAHARAGDAALISGYLGTTDGFDVAIAEYAMTYADITERDHAQLMEWLESSDGPR